MVIYYVVFACCFLLLVPAAPDAPVDSIRISEHGIKLAGRSGVLDLADARDVEALLTVLYELCDYYSTCNTSLHIPDNVQRFLGCCVPCDCSDDCFVVGNCCRDKVGEPRLTTSGEIMSEHGEVCSLVNPINNVEWLHSQLLVTQCSPEYQGDAMDMCGKLDAGTIEDLTPVYSNQSGLTYSNVHCARCNYQNQSLEWWMIQMDCDSYVPLRPHASTEDLTHQNGCRFEWLTGLLRPTPCYRTTDPDDCERVRFHTLCNAVRQGYGFVNSLKAGACGSSCSLQLGFSPICTPPMPPGLNSQYSTFVSWDGNAALNLPETEAICQDEEHFYDIEVCICTNTPKKVSKVFTHNHYSIHAFICFFKDRRPR